MEPGRVGAMLEPALRSVPLAVAGGAVAALVTVGVENVLSDGFAATLIAVVAAAVAFAATFLLAGRALAPFATRGAANDPSPE